MLLTITTTHRPATDLGYLLHKNPERVHTHETSFGRAVLFYPERDEERCTVALALDVDPVALVRGKGKDKDGLLDQYVNDRPYVASSFLSVAIANTLRNALGGSSKERQALADTAIPLSATVTPLPVRGSDMIERLFAPLGYAITVTPIALDETWPEWGASPYVSLTLEVTTRLRDLLAHLYVLIPVLDKRKHYFVERTELEKLLAKGQGWLGAHPDKKLIADRYLRFKRSWTSEVLARLADDAGETDDDAVVAEPVPAGGAVEPSEEVVELKKDAAEEQLEKPLRLHEQRLDRVADVLVAARAHRVVDLGCGSGKLLKRLMAEKQFTEILGVDVHSLSLELAERRLKLERLPERQRSRIRLIQGALTYRDRRIEGYDAAALVEVIEHVEPERLPAMERVVFELARPQTVVITTPNREYNARFAGMAAGALRHADHRFEWTRAEFRDWAEPVAQRHGYTVVFEGIGEEDAELGHPSQMAVFTR
jgi:3' terminal RNA ribose 2'-O-methyltransferase Hen1